MPIKFMFTMEPEPRYPVYIISKGRWERRQTARLFDMLQIPHFVVVEIQEFDLYKQALEGTCGTPLILPQHYLLNYQTCDKVTDKSVGAGAARNFCWDTSIKNGHPRHWVFDDNIDSFYRLNRNMKLLVKSRGIMAAAEDFVDRYDNIAIAGFHYNSFIQKESVVAPYRLNTRIYSCLLIQNDIPYRWRGRYNEDTDLSLRVLKDGWCTLLFNTFLINKETTQRQKGGNTKEFYEHEGTFLKSKMLEEMHPDVAKVVTRFNRDHHVVDYSRFKQKLIRKNIDIPAGINNYGMVIKEYPQKMHITKIQRSQVEV